METKPDKWTIILARLPMYDDGVECAAGVYKATGVLLNGKLLRIRTATLSMSAGSLVSLNLEILPRDLEIIMEEPHSQETV